jgi:hypothetical protein
LLFAGTVPCTASYSHGAFASGPVCASGSALGTSLDLQGLVDVLVTYPLFPG